MSKTCTALAAAFLLVLTPAAAHADWLLSPMLGQTFGGDTHGRVHTVFGAAVGQLDEEAFGWEADFAYSPDFFEGADDDFDFTGNNSRVVTAMLNVLASGTTTAIRPYVTVGLGLIQVDVESNDGLFESTTRELGYNAGVGLMGLIGDRVGLRADLRYIRSFQNQLPSWTRGIDADVAPGNFDYFRAGVGVTFRLGE
jgi:opacity protein-like surface antigen